MKAQVSINFEVCADTTIELLRERLAQTLLDIETKFDVQSNIVVTVHYEQLITIERG